MAKLQLRSVLTAISLFGMALPGSVAAEDVLPSIEELTTESDFTVFMAPEVPAETKTLALRQLWRFRGWESDGLNNYDTDYTAIEPVRRTAVAD